MQRTNLGLSLLLMVFCLICGQIAQSQSATQNLSASFSQSGGLDTISWYDTATFGYVHGTIYKGNVSVNVNLVYNSGNSAAYTGLESEYSTSAVQITNGTQLSTSGYGSVNASSILSALVPTGTYYYYYDVIGTATVSWPQNGVTQTAVFTTHKYSPTYMVLITR